MSSFIVMESSELAEFHENTQSASSEPWVVPGVDIGVVARVVSLLCTLVALLCVALLCTVAPSGPSGGGGSSCGEQSKFGNKSVTCSPAFNGIHAVKLNRMLVVNPCSAMSNILADGSATRSNKSAASPNRSVDTPK
eukprot:1561179-Rhodomonas_salina.1